jgi:hypothetical protein
VILVDALGWDAVESGSDGRFLGDLLPHRRPLETILGFSSGALPALLTGRWPRQTGRWLMYARARGSTPLGVAGPFARLPARLRRSHRVSRLLHRLVALRVGGYFSLYEIPWCRLPFLDLPERRHLYAPNAVPGHPTWFDDWAALGLTARVWDWRTPEPANAEAFVAACGGAGGNAEVLFWYLHGQDALRHRHGNRAPEVAAHLAWVGEQVRRGADAVRRSGDEPWIFLLSDHGMTDVRFHVDLAAEAAAAAAGAGEGEREGTGWVAFHDSTMSRFWWLDARARERARPAIRARLAERGMGSWLGVRDLARYGADFADSRFGEDIFVLDAGGLVVPSYMSATPVRGMHGYRPEEPTSRAILLTNRPLGAGLAHVVDVRSHLLAEWHRLDACRRS